MDNSPQALPPLRKDLERSRRKTKPVRPADRLLTRTSSSSGSLMSICNNLMHGWFGRNIVTNISPAHPENHVFSDIGGVVGYALQIPGHEQCIQCLPGYL